MKGLQMAISSLLRDSFLSKVSCLVDRSANLRLHGLFLLSAEFTTSSSSDHGYNVVVRMETLRN